MSFNQFPEKKPGDKLSAGHINRLSRIARRVDVSGMGSYQNRSLGGAVSGFVSFPAWLQVPVEITNLNINSSDTKDSGLYLCKIRYADPVSGSSDEVDWEMQEKEWRLDATSTEIRLAVGDRVNAYWYQQRGMFIPTAGTPGIYIAKPNESDGIPPLVDDVPGKANCWIYEIGDDDELVIVEGEGGNPIEKEVYNISRNTVPRDWIVIAREAFGNWVALPVQQTVMMISAKVNEAGHVAAGDATFDIDSVEIIAPAGATTYPDGTEDAPTVCNNVLGVPAQDDARVIAFYNYVTKLWEGLPHIYTTECP